MDSQTYSSEELERAHKHVKKLKAWYALIPMYLVGTVVMLAMSRLMYVNDEPATVIWILMSCTVAMWVIVMVQGFMLRSKMPKFIKTWEERKIQGLIKKEVGLTKYE